MHRVWSYDRPFCVHDLKKQGCRSFFKSKSITLWQCLLVLLFVFPHPLECSQLKHLQLSNLMVNPSECPADQDENHRNMFRLCQKLHFFWLHHAEKYFKVSGCLRRSVHTARFICLYQMHFLFKNSVETSTELHNSINKNCFGGRQSRYKSYKTSQDVKYVYMFMFALGRITVIGAYRPTENSWVQFSRSGWILQTQVRWQEGSCDGDQYRREVRDLTGGE